MTTERDDIIFKIHYSLTYDAMNEVFYQRLDTAISFICIIFGATVVGNLGFEYLTGITIVIASTLAILIKPGEKAAQFRNSKKSYIRLSELLPGDNEELKAKFAALQENDHEGVNAFRSAAYIRAGLITGRDVANEKLSTFEYYMSKLGGEFLSKTGNE